MGCTSSKNKREKTYHIAPEAEPANVTSPDIVYKPDEVSLDGRAKNVCGRETMAQYTTSQRPLPCTEEYTGLPCFMSASTTATAAALPGVTEHHYLLPNDASVSNGYASHRSLHVISAPEEVQPWISGQMAHNHEQEEECYYTSRSANVPNGLPHNHHPHNYDASQNYNSSVHILPSEAKSMTEHIVVDFKSNNGNVAYSYHHNNAKKDSSNYFTNGERNANAEEQVSVPKMPYTYTSANNRTNCINSQSTCNTTQKQSNICLSNTSKILPLVDPQVVEVTDVIDTFHNDHNNEYYDSEIVIIPTPQTAIKKEKL